MDALDRQTKKQTKNVRVSLSACLFVYVFDVV